ncbi:Acetyl-CoA hydrolase/transferase C-terminal domain-containing protein [Fontimonas thermophila]|uniref:Acetyl-CoA hydrolase/transferase C-terminal domain-containing protein n=1 Tax=Fontimonas thermophila TaxID=1076937 RepID=A0A1I2H8R1_9GAMM|nr:acetyl-CoA hydrolase/transferase C-terminal domain-containing protein [Fontimonas thermophila]SFF25377.1 Acetyl-CoA hydrolase/transferase C-terminal domain-containing protein [Fontimonas thermophila]
MKPPPQVLSDVEAAVDATLARLGKTIVLGLPLGLGKPVELTNAFYRRARLDPSIRLKILTALSLEKPRGGNRIEQAFLQPFVDRVFAGVPDLDYVRDLRENRLPPNVEICEFYFRPGSMLGNAHAQQHYISSNYTHAARDVFNQGCNVVAQTVARRTVDNQARYSLSCNPDTGPELMQMLRESGRPHLKIAVVNQNLPYFGLDAEVEADAFDIVVDDARYTTALFPTPKMAVSVPDYFIGLNASSLVRDGGTLQIGIGALADALVHALLLRHREPAVYRRVLADTGILSHNAALIEAIGGTDPFVQGLYGATEMFVDGFLHLLRAGILKRRVYDFWALQQLINEGQCDPDRLMPDVLDGFARLGVRVIRGKDFDVLQHHGFFADDVRYDNGHIVAADGTRVVANVADPASRAVLARCLGEHLRNGILLHGGFFLGPTAFYRDLCALDDATRNAICLTSVAKTNQLDYNPRLYRQQRRHARFINTGMMATLSGAVCSDGLQNLQVVSGVGGQYNFVAMAHQLPAGRSILLIRATRESETGGAPTSNIVFNYGHTTIPRHLRDIVVTEYGIADLRSKTDSEVAKALIHIADARFQQDLLKQAQRAGKIEADYVIPPPFRDNRPERLEALLAAHRAHFPPFPLGCDFTDEELRLGAALKAIKRRAAAMPRWRLLLKALRPMQPPAAASAVLRRLGLDAPQDLHERIARALLIETLSS